MLVTGASGGVGTYAVQIAVALGAEVTAVCSAGKADLVRSLGAAHVLDYATDDLADGTRHYDLIVDIAGNTPLKRLRRALSPRGRSSSSAARPTARWPGASAARSGARSRRRSASRRS